MIEFTGVRNSWLMFERNFDFTSSAPQVIRALVELGVERDPAVRVLELAVERDQLVLTLRELLERAQRLLVLPLDLVDGVRRPDARAIGDARERVGAHEPAPRGRNFARNHGGPSTDVLMMNRSISRRVPDAESHAGVRHRPSTTAPRSAMPPPRSGHLDDQQLRHRAAFDPERHLPAFGVAERVPRDLGHGGRNTRLVLRIELEDAGDLARALPGEDDVGLVAQRDGENGLAHAASRRTTMAASSVRRAWSR